MPLSVYTSDGSLKATLDGAVHGPGSVTNRGIATWNTTDSLYDNLNATIDSGGILQATAYKLPAAVELTEATDAVTVNQGFHTVKAETGTADDLATVNGGSGVLFVTFQAKSGHTITVKNGTGNINLNGGADFALSGDKTLTLFFDGTNWADIGAGGSSISFATPAIALGSAAAAGAASTVIRSDSTIAAFDTTAPTNSAVGDSAAVGVIAFAARRDHVHGREAFATPSIALGSSAAAGAAATLIRSDSTIAAFDATNPHASAPGDSAAVGTAAFAARRDHVHAREAFGASGDIGAETFGVAVAAGSSGKVADAGHVHSLPGLRLVQGRLTLTSGTPVTVTDVTGATTVYFTPYKGNQIMLYDGTKWVTITFTEKSVAVPSTTNELYDIFGVLSSGDLALETLAWNVPSSATIAASGGITNASPRVVTTTANHGFSTDQIVTISGNSVPGNNATWRVGTTTATTFQLLNLDGTNSSAPGSVGNNGTAQRRDENQTRATALTTQDGALVKSGAATRLYLGTIRTTTTSGQCEDSVTHGYLYNYYNRVIRQMSVANATSHVYTSAVWRPWNNDLTNRTDLVMGWLEDNILLGVTAVTTSGAAGNQAWGGVAVDLLNTSHVSGYNATGQTMKTSASVPFMLTSAGYHFLQSVEFATVSDTFVGHTNHPSWLG